MRRWNGERSCTAARAENVGKGWMKMERKKKGLNHEELCKTS